MPATTPYARLRARMQEQGVERLYLAVKIERKLTYVDKRINGHSPWTQKEMYTIMDLLYIPHDQLHLYFPPGGIEEKFKASTKSHPQEALQRYVLVPESMLQGLKAVTS